MANFKKWAFIPALILSLQIAHAQIFAVGGKLVSQTPPVLWEPDESFNELLMEEWDTNILPDGAVAAFTSPINTAITATQATGASQPVKDHTLFGGVGAISFTGNQFLTIPSITDPWRRHYSFIAIFQADLTHATINDGFIFSIDGGSGAGRSPSIGYTRSNHTIQVQWGNGPNQCTISLAWPDDTNLHVVTGHRWGGLADASIDGNPPVDSGGTNCIMSRTTGTGVMGDIRGASSINWALNYLSFEQDQMTADMEQRANAWGMWRIGRQAAMPGGNPWFSTPPTSSPYVNPYLMNTAADFQAVQTSLYWNSSGPGTCPGIKCNYPNTIAPIFVGLNPVKTFTFNTLSILGDEAAAAGGTAQFFCPVLDQVGPDTIVSPAVNVPPVYSTNGSTVTMTVQNSGGFWYAGNCLSVNLGGQGYTFTPGSTYTCVQVFFSAGLGNGTAIDTAPIYLYPAYWMWNATTPREEMDAIETYNGENAGANVHLTEHYHVASIPYGGRLASEQSAGKDFQLNVAHIYPGTPPDVSTYDGNIHEYDLCRNTTLSIVALDGNELGRWTTQAFMLNPSMIVTGVALSTLTGAAGTYPFNIQSIVVWQ